MLRDRLKSAGILISIILLLIGLDHRFPLAGATGLWLLPLLLMFSLGTAMEFARLLALGGRPVGGPLSESKNGLASESAGESASDVASEPAASSSSLVSSGGGLELSLVSVLPAALLVTLSTSIPLLAGVVADVFPGVFGGMSAVGQSLSATGWLVLALLVATFWVLVREIASYPGIAPPPGQPLSQPPAQPLSQTLVRIFATTFVVGYVAVPMAMLVLVRQLRDPGWGLAALITLIAVTKSCDAGAYFTGKALGRHKLIPRLSPGKTWEGVIGGVGTSIAVAYLCFGWLMPALAATPPVAGPFWGAIVFGMVCAVAGILGDLAESLVKRETGAKDSGRTLPGLGGVWDVTDSLIAAAVPAWAMLAAGLAGT